MATVTITLRDKEGGGCHVEAKFEPAPEKGQEQTNAQWSAGYMMNALNKRLRKPLIFNIIPQ